MKFLLHQGLAFRGHNESEDSSNRGNFIELLKFLAANSEEVNKYVLNNAPGNCLLTSPKIQKQLIQSCAIETRKKIIEELGEEPFAILADESSDISHKEQLVLVAVAKGNNDCVWFFDQVSLLLNIVGVSCKRHGMIRNSRLESIMKAIECGELETGSGLNHERGLPRLGDTRWGSHYRTIVNIISMYPTIRDVLITLGEDPTQKGDWPKIHAIVGVFESFDFVFAAHLMLIILGYTNELSECLQRREQDILNAISLVRVAKARMQKLRSNGWDQFLQRVTLFCNKHGVQVPAMDGQYVPYGRSARFARNQTIDDHFRRKYLLGLLIISVKSLTIDLMRLIWSCFLVCQPSVLLILLLFLRHKSYVGLLISTLMTSLSCIWSNLNCNLTIILMTSDMRIASKVLIILLNSQLN